MKSKLTLGAACAAFALAAGPLHAVALNILYVANADSTTYKTFATSNQFAGSTWTFKASGLTANETVGGDLDRSGTFGGSATTLKAYMESFDLVIVGLAVTSGNFVDGALGADWASIDTPILFNAALASRATGGRVGLTSGDNSVAGYAFNNANETTKVSNSALGNALFAGTSATNNLYSVTTGDIITTTATIGTGEQIATVTNGTTTARSLVYWESGATDSLGRTLVADRALFALKGGFADLTADGQIVLGNLITELTAIPEPSSFAALAGAGALGFVAIRRRRSRA